MELDSLSAHSRSPVDQSFPLLLQPFVVDLSTSSGTFQSEFVNTSVLFMTCLEPGAYSASLAAGDFGRPDPVAPRSMTSIDGVVATASSFSAGQPPSAAIDGQINGYVPAPGSGDYTKVRLDCSFVSCHACCKLMC